MRGDSAASTAQHAAEAAQRAPHQARRKAEGNPLAAGLIALGAGWLLASLLPPSEAEKQAAAKVKDQAQPVAEEAKSQARSMAEDLKGPAQESAQRVQDSAAQSAETVKAEGQSQKETVDVCSDPIPRGLMHWGTLTMWLRLPGGAHPWRSAPCGSHSRTAAAARRWPTPQCGGRG